MSTKIISRPRLSFKAQNAAAFIAVILSVIIPQMFHIMGMLSGTGSAPGEVFLPMHLPVILAGLLAGPYAGAMAGAIGPLASFLLTGMPTSAMLPFMMIELFGYGLFAGLLRDAKMPSVAKVLLVQIGGRVVRAAAIFAAVYVFSSTDVAVASVWMSILKGLPGLAIQWTLIPLAVYRIENRRV